MLYGLFPPRRLSLTYVALFASPWEPFIDWCVRVIFARGFFAGVYISRILLSLACMRSDVLWHACYLKWGSDKVNCHISRHVSCYVTKTSTLIYDIFRVVMQLCRDLPWNRGESLTNSCDWSLASIVPYIAKLSVAGMTIACSIELRVV